MLISVDLPAPFSPTMPWIEPRPMVTETARLACTAPKRLSMPISSTAGAADAAAAGATPAAAVPMEDDMPCRLRAVVVFRVVVDLDRAGDDVLLRLFDLGLHIGRDQRLVVVVERPAHTLFLEAEHLQPGLPGAVLRGLEGVVGGEVDALHHRGQHRAGMDVVLVAVDADGELAGVLGRLIDAHACAAGRRIDDIGAAIELALRELPALR